MNFSIVDIMLISFYIVLCDRRGKTTTTSKNISGWSHSQSRPTDCHDHSSHGWCERALVFWSSSCLVECCCRCLVCREKTLILKSLDLFYLCNWGFGLSSSPYYLSWVKSCKSHGCSVWWPKYNVFDYFMFCDLGVSHGLVCCISSSFGYSLVFLVISSL